MRRPVFPRSLLLAAALTAVSASACGYRPMGYTGEVDGLRTVAIVTPENGSYVAGVEYVVADALRREFLRRRALRLTEDVDTADIVLDGSVNRVSTKGRSFSSVTFNLEFEIVMELALEARERSGGTRPLSRRSLIESEYYLASADVEATRKNRDEALRRIAMILAQRIHDDLIEASFQ